MSAGSGVQHRPRRKDQIAHVVSNVHPFADDWVTCLGQVDADLVGASGRETTRRQGRTLKLFHGLDVGDGQLPLATESRGAAQAVPAILDEVRLECLR
jgi:hypothetical protein